MRRYTRTHLAGGCWFFTANLAQRKSQQLLVHHINVFRDAVRKTRLTHPFGIDAVCVLPDHIHAVWTVPADDGDFSVRWRLLKSHCSRALPKIEEISESRQAKGERGIWQRRFWEHQIRDDENYARHVNCTHFNPVKHEWVKRAADWPYSTLHQSIQEGRLPYDWGVGVNVIVNGGE